MNQKMQLSILEFSRLTGIKRENLRFYDRIGLLTPEKRGENKYRYYSRRQLNSAYLITNLRGLGVGIEDIKKYCANQTPEKTLALFAQQETRIQAEIKQLKEVSSIMQMHTNMMCEALAHNKNALFLQEKEREPIFVCPAISEEMDDDEAGISSYEYAEANGINTGFPQGSVIAQERLETGNVTWVDRYYFKVVSKENDWKPAGLYAVAYGLYDPWKSEGLYLRLLAFIREQGLSICGNAYEEYPLGDIVAQDTEQYCMRIEIPVNRFIP